MTSSETELLLCQLINTLSSPSVSTDDHVLKEDYKVIVGDGIRDKWICVRNLVEPELQRKYLDFYSSDIGRCDARYRMNSSKSFRIDYRTFSEEQSLIEKAKMIAQQTLKCDLPFVTLDGVALVYGTNASMAEHTDSLSRPHVTTEEWTLTINIGCDICFKLNGKELVAHSGDVIIMDSRAVLHGVTKIVPNTCPPDIPLRDARFGVIVWESA